MGKKVLIADDSLTLLTKCKVILGKANYEVFTSDNGIEAVEKFEQIRPDVLVIDHQMPKMDGVEASRQIRKKFGDAKIILLTGTGQNWLRDQAKDAGIAKFLEKPFDDKELLDTIHSLI